MSKCPKCGAEAEAGMNFCLECGTKIPQDKECPACHARWPVSAKFCAECGHRFVESAGSGGGPAVGIGDKNVIAGDVSLSNTTNTTNYINQDETRRVVKCATCGKSLVITEAFTCVVCGEYVCEDHYDKAHRKCMVCQSKQVESAESKYRARLDEILEDGIIDADEFGQLECLRKELGISSARSMELTKQAKAARLARTSAKTVDTPLMTVEKAQCERARQILFENGKAQEAVALLESIYKNHPVNESVLEVLLTALQMFDAERARKIIGELPVDIVVAYLTLVDLELRKGDLAEAERKLAAAEKLWPDSNLVKCRRVALMYATAKELDNRTFLAEAMDILTSIPEPASKLEKSWGFYLQYLISKELGDEVPVIDKAFCQAQGIYYALMDGTIIGLKAEASESDEEPDEENPFEDNDDDEQDPFKGVLDEVDLSDADAVVGVSSKASYSTIEEAVKHVDEGGLIVVEEGTYKESFTLDKKVSIVAKNNIETVVVEREYGNDFAMCVKADATFRNISFTGPAFCDGGASLVFAAGESTVDSCRFEGLDSGVAIIGDSRVSLTECVFADIQHDALCVARESFLSMSDTVFEDSNAVFGGGSNVNVNKCVWKGSSAYGVKIQDSSTCVFENCTIENCKGHGIDIQSKEANVAVKECTIENCGDWGIHIKGTYERWLKANQCSEFNFVYKNDELFRFENDGVGICRIDGPTSYNFNNTQNIITAARFSNDAEFHSGDLYITLWLSKTKYTGGQLDGIAVAKGYLGALTDGFGYSNKKVQCERLVGYRKASGGDYYPVIAVNELTVEPDGTEHRYIVGWVCYENKCHWS